MYVREIFTTDERAILSRFFTNIDGPVFALINLPEVVKSALFARYSRSHNRYVACFWMNSTIKLRYRLKN